MTVARVAAERPDPAVLSRAAELLAAGELVAFPTETVYGLGANALDAEAVGRLYAAKGRPAHNPLIVHVADADAARGLTTVWPDAAAALARRYWPGPLTLVLPRVSSIPSQVTAGLATVALRVPAHPIALALLRAAGLPLAAPSANRSGEVSPTTAAHVVQSLGSRVPLILDAGPTSVGIESTVLDLSGGEPLLLRPGMLTRDELAEWIGPIRDPVRPAAGTAPRAAPGMLERHYAPRATVVVYRSPQDPALSHGLEAARLADGKAGALSIGPGPDGVDLHVTLPGDPAGYARGLYGALHQLDDAGMSVILIEQPPEEPAWAGIRDRLRRAAQPPVRPGT